MLHEIPAGRQLLKRLPPWLRSSFLEAAGYVNGTSIPVDGGSDG